MLVVAVLLAIGFPAGAQVPPLDYVASWELDEGVGAVTHGQGPAGAVGLLSGAAWAPGISGSGLQFGGAASVELTDGAGIPGVLGTLTQGTISLWFRFEAIPGRDLIHPLFYLGDGVGGDGNSGLIIEVGHFDVGARLFFTVVDDERNIPLCFDTGFHLVPQRWYHFAAVVGPDFNTGYLDGVELVNRHYNFGGPGVRAFLADVVDQQVAWLGRGFLGAVPTEQFLEGALDEIRVYDRPLSAGEIAAYRHATLGPGPAPVEIVHPRDGSTLHGVVDVLGGSSLRAGQVEISIDGGPFVLAAGLTSWSHPWDTTTVADGAHQITARARSAPGAPYHFDTVTVSVGNPGSGLAVEVLTPGNGDVLWGPTTILGMASGVQGVEIAIDNGPYLAGTGGASWSFHFDASGLVPGPHRIRARGVGPAGTEVISAVEVVVSASAPPAPSCATLYPGTALPVANAAAPARLDLGPPTLVVVHVIGDGGSRGYSDDLQLLLDADPPGGHTFVVEEHAIEGAELWRWTAAGEPADQAVQGILSGVNGPAIALVAVSNSLTFPLATASRSDPNHQRYVSSCLQLAARLGAAGQGLSMSYFAAPRMQPARLMPLYHETLALRDVMLEAASVGLSTIDAGPAHHDLHWCGYPALYAPDRMHPNGLGDAVLARTWFHFLKKRLNGDITLEVDDLATGQPASVWVTGASPDADCLVLASATGLGLVDLSVIGLTIDLDAPVILLPAKRTDASGAASWGAMTPPGLAGLRLWFQAIQLGHESNVVERVLR